MRDCNGKPLNYGDWVMVIAPSDNPDVPGWDGPLAWQIDYIERYGGCRAGCVEYASCAASKVVVCGCALLKITGDDHEALPAFLRSQAV